MDWLRRKPAMKPLERNPQESHHPVRSTDGMELKAGSSLLMGRGWISRKNLVAGEVFFLTSFLIEPYSSDVIFTSAAHDPHSDQGRL
jgi:hypothetical protein